MLGSCIVIAVSWRALHHPRSHGFYRFFAFEGVLLLVVLNLPYWFGAPFSPLHLLSWQVLGLSLLFLFWGVVLLRCLGGVRQKGRPAANLPFENTGLLVTTGIYRFIRHPMYSSLLLLAWGAFLKHISLFSVVVVGATSLLLYATARAEERENLAFFGGVYREYMKRTRMFLPFLF